MVQKAVTLWGPKEFRAIDQEGCFSNRYQPILENGEPIPFRFRTLMSRRSWDGGSIRPLPADWLAAVKG